MESDGKETEQRRGTDRRRQPRGGRRETDQLGYAPLVMVLESEEARRDVTETILATSRFAVAPVESIDGALAICKALAPSVIVCNESDGDRLRAELHPLVIPIVMIGVQSDPAGELIERIRAALRGAVRT